MMTRLTESTDSEILHSSFTNYQNRNPEDFEIFIKGLSSAHLDVFNSIKVDVSGYTDAEQTQKRKDVNLSSFGFVQHFVT